jgi:hypothetical protein
MVKVAFRKSILSRSSRSRCIRRDEEGVASVIGTIMALLIFMTFMTMFINTYIPIWMKENERLHMNEVQDQMGEIKGKIDNLIVGAQITGSSAINTYQTITMGADGIPIFASPTAGAVILKPTGITTSGVNVQFNYTVNNQKVLVNENGGGKLEFYAPNRYYVGQWLAYENGGLIVKQDQGEAMKAMPSFGLVKSGNSVNVDFTQIDLVGTNSTMAGTGVAGVNIDLIYLDAQKYTPHYGIGADQNTTVFKFITIYSVSFMSFINSTIKNANLQPSEYKLTKTVNTDKSSTITLKIINTGSLTLNRAFVKVDIGV